MVRDEFGAGDLHGQTFFRSAQIVRYYYRGFPEVDAHYVLALFERSNRKTESIMALQTFRPTPRGKPRPPGSRWSVGNRYVTKATDAEVKEGRKLQSQIPDNAPVIEHPAKVGCRMEFTDRQGKVVFGTVIRVSQKTVSLQPDDSEQYWRVPPHLLRPSDN